MLVVDLIRNASHNPNENNTVVADCREGISRIPRVQIQHCYREASKCEDALARRGALLPHDFFVFDSPSANVALLLSLDVTRTLYECSGAPVSSF